MQSGGSGQTTESNVLYLRLKGLPQQVKHLSVFDTSSRSQSSSSQDNGFDCGLFVLSTVQWFCQAEPTVLKREWFKVDAKNKDVGGDWFCSPPFYSV